MVATRSTIGAQSTRQVIVGGLIAAAPPVLLPSPIRSQPAGGYTIDPSADGSVRLLDAEGHSFGNFTTAELAQTTINFLSR